jgi:amidophosphoribosyltransferase
MGLEGRNAQQPQYCDACFSGDYPVPLVDQDAGDAPAQLSLLAERR